MKTSHTNAWLRLEFAAFVDEIAKKAGSSGIGSVKSICDAVYDSNRGGYISSLKASLEVIPEGETAKLVQFIISEFIEKIDNYDVRNAMSAFVQRVGNADRACIFFSVGEMLSKMPELDRMAQGSFFRD